MDVQNAMVIGKQWLIKNLGNKIFIYVFYYLLYMTNYCFRIYLYPWVKQWIDEIITHEELAELCFNYLTEFRDNIQKPSMITDNDWQMVLLGLNQFIVSFGTLKIKSLPEEVDAKLGKLYQWTEQSIEVGNWKLFLLEAIEEVIDATDGNNIKRSIVRVNGKNGYKSEMLSEFL